MISILRNFFVIMTIISILDVLFNFALLKTANKKDLDFMQYFAYILAILCGLGGSYAFAYLACNL